MHDTVSRAEQSSRTDQPPKSGSKSRGHMGRRKDHSHRRMNSMMTYRSDEFIPCVHIYCDGAWRENRAAVGFVIYDQSYRARARYGSIVDAITSNSAEYIALIYALDSSAAYTRKEVHCFLDSDVVLGQMTGRYRLKSERLRRLYHRVKDYERPFERVIYCGIGRRDQRHAVAHKLAQDALNGRVPVSNGGPSPGVAASDIIACNDEVIHSQRNSLSENL